MSKDGLRREFDLFGHPLPRNLGRAGRNEHVATAENIDKVRALLLAGWRGDAIAQELGISEPTLRKHYFRTIDAARRQALAESRAKVMVQLAGAAGTGNVSAMKELLRVIGEQEMSLGLVMRPEPDAPAPRPGKKEQAQSDSVSAHEGTTWGSILQ